MISLNEIYWAAGFLEGEGYFKGIGRQSGIFAKQVQKWPLEKLRGYLKGSICLEKKPPGSKHNDIWSWQLTTKRAIGLMMTIYPLMSPKRQDQILKAINLWKLRPLHPGDRKKCPRGHLYSPDNTIIDKRGRRYCLACQKENYRYRGTRPKKKKVRVSENQLTFHY